MDIQVSEDITAIIKQAAFTVGKEGLKSAIQKVFVKKPDLFKLKVDATIATLKERYSDDLFGRNMNEFLSSREAIAEYEKWLLPFEEPDLKVLGKTIDFETLPENFFNDFKTVLIEKLYKDLEFREQLHEKLMLLLLERIDQTTQKNQSTSEKIFDNTEALVQSVSSLERAIRQFQKSEQDIDPVRRKTYHFNHDYIARSIYQLNGTRIKFQEKEQSLTEIGKERKRILILSAGGLGKTMEVENLADYYSLPENQEFFPVLIRLNHYGGQDILYWLTKELPDFEKVAPSQLVLLFDGLDEVHVDFFDVAIKQLLSFGHDQKYKDSRIIISCRDNFYNPEFGRQFEGKEPYTIIKLKEIEYGNILKHGYLKLGDSLAAQFFKQVSEKGLTSIITNPFFYKYLLTLFDQSRMLPSSKTELFEALIELRIARDKERSATSGTDLHKKGKRLRSQIERLALIMETQGKNYIADDELEQIIPEGDNRQLIERSFLFDRAKENTWQFEHNNFQEYLAAKKIASFSLEQIQRLVTVSPDYTKIKPTWVNTLSFLFLLVPKESTLFQNLMRWIMEIDRELILRTEKERLDLELREKFFKQILEHYQNQGLLTRSEKFDSRDLAQFISESRKIFPYLIDRLKNSSNYLIVSELVSMLPEFEFVNDFRFEIESILEKYITDKNTNEITRYSCVHALASLGWQRKRFLNKLLTASNLERSQYGRAGAYKYLIGSSFLVNQLDLIVHLIECDDEITDDTGRIDLGDENIYRDEALREIVTLSGIKKILNYFIKSTAEGKHDFIVRSILGDILENAAVLFRSGTDSVFRQVLTTFVGFIRETHETYREVFGNFFTSTETIKRACLTLLNQKKDSNHALAGLAMLADQPFVELLVNEYKVGALGAKKINAVLLNLRIYSQQSIHDHFYRLINEASLNRFKYPDYPNYNRINADRRKMDLELLFNREQFILRVEGIYTLEQTDSLERTHIQNFYRLFMRGNEPQEVDNNLVIETLQRRLEQPLAKADAIAYFMDDSKWEWFQISTLLKYDVENYVPFEEREIKFIHKWCDKQIEISDFQNQYRNIEILLGYFIPRFDFHYPEKIYVDLLSVYGNDLPIRNEERKKQEERERLVDYVIKKVGLEKVINRVVENLKLGLKIPSVIRNHISLARKYNIKQALPSIVQYFKSDKLNGYSLVHSVEDYLELGGDIQFAEAFLERPSLKMDEHDNSRLEDILIKFKSAKIKAHLLTLLAERSKIEEKLSYARKLMKLGEVEGLKFYSQWVKDKKSLNDFIGRNLFERIPTKDALPEMLEMGHVCMQPDFSRDSIRGQDQDLFNAINERAIESEINFQQVRGRYLEWIENYKPNAFVRYYLNDLENKYYTKLGQDRPLAETIKLVDSLLSA